MINKRLFTFGCSFTKYNWPTWADIIGTNYKTHYNFGHAGAGNYYISLKLYETHSTHQITSNDDVIIMLSSVNRMDIYDSITKKFKLNGNIYNSEHIFGEKFVRDVWNDEHSIYNTWFMVKTIKTLLDSIGCRYKIVEAFGLLETDEGFHITYDKNIKSIVDDYLHIVYTKETLQNFTKKYNPPSYILSNGKLDGHATIMCNHDFAQLHLSEFYRNEMRLIANKWENEIGLDVLNSNFSSQKIK